MAALEQRIKQRARELGFELVGIASAAEADTFGRLREWLDRGFAGEMEYMGRHGEARRSPTAVLPEVRAVIMVGLSYAPDTGAGPQPRPDRARVARYAVGQDYHAVLRRKLKELLAWLQGVVPSCRGRAIVDTAPLLERDFARRAGLGWFGKNTMLLNRRLGSYFFLGALLVDRELEPDAPHAASHCGSCTACLDACPTQAFVGPGTLDARRCISYLTIELKGAIPADLRPGVGSWLFGCDVCQEVCPWNRKAPPGNEAALALAAEVTPDPADLLGLSEAEFRRRFRDRALARPRRGGLLRNASIVLGNVGTAADLPALRKALADPDPLVREAARWAIDQIRSRTEAAAVQPPT